MTIPKSAAQFYLGSKLAWVFTQGLMTLLGIGLDEVTLSVKPERKDLKAGTSIVEDVAAFIRRFVFLRDEVLYDLTAEWIVMTYLTDLFDYVGYIFAHSPKPQSGKSILLGVLNLLVKDSSGILVSPTEAVLYRTAKQTQLLDEVDSCLRKEELRSVLNAGFERNGVVIRMKEANGNFEPEKLNVYSPRALAGIGSGILHVATRDRAFVFQMVRQMKNERRERLRLRRIKAEVDSLKTRIAEWAITNHDSVQKVYEESNFPYLEAFGDRTIDIAQPLAAIIEVAYAESPRLNMARQRLVRAITVTRGEEGRIDEQLKVIRQLVRLAEDEDPLIGNPTELSGLCDKLFADPASKDDISAALKQFDFNMKSCRKNGEPRHRYDLPKAKLSEILERYGWEELPIPVATCGAEDV
jgi:hypothetical protein